MPPPPVQPREPAAPSSAAGPPSPEFMWCQRSDRVYVTIKVADCVRAAVHVNDGELSFSGHGHGARGTRDYALSLRLAGAVVPSRCCWFVCGPSVRVRLEKEAAGPYWDSLMVGVKPPQCKIDWQSWIDEDEECEVSAAPSGFEANDLQMQMVGQSIEFYRDESRLTSSEEEGEEEDSVMMDHGLNSVDALSVKFRALEVEKAARARSKAERRQRREATRDALAAADERSRDLKYGRPARELSEEEEGLVAGAGTLRQRLKEQKRAERLYWLSRAHHQMRPQEKDTAKARAAANRAAHDELARHVSRLKQVGVDALVGDESRRRTRHAIRAAALEAAYMEVGYKDAAPIVAHELAAAAAREAMGEPPPQPIEAAAEAAAEAAGLRHAGIRPEAEDDEIALEENEERSEELRLEENTELAEGQAEGVDESEDSLQLEENMEGLEGGPPAVLV
mmetsp:Transcript_33681/g.105878  ORF Transcript_33681/g.105878 Transcript_33681/m.105878 type:complete len:451 (-) Transcript_33681:34-1386(-)